MTCNCWAGFNRRALLQVTVRPVDQLTVDDSWSFLTNVKNRLTEYFIKVSLNDGSEVIGQIQSHLYYNHCLWEFFGQEVFEFCNSWIQFTIIQFCIDFYVFWARIRETSDVKLKRDIFIRNDWVSWIFIHVDMFLCILICVLYSITFSGDNCTGEIQAKEFMPNFIPITCELEFSSFVNGLSISDLFQVSATFSSKKGRKEVHWAILLFSNLKKIFIPDYAFELIFKSFFFFKGKYGCLVKKLHPETLVQQISTTAVDLQLSVLVPGMENQPAVLAPVKKYQYLPPFYVHNSEVSLSTAAPLSSIRVSTIPDLSSCIQVH